MKLENRHTSIDVQSMGAMISSAEFYLENGQSVSPFFQAPWKLDNNLHKSALPALLGNLGAEWVCVPFGGPGSRNDLPGDWRPNFEAVDWDGYPHGYSSNHDWELTKLSTRALRAEIIYPNNTPIERLEREIRLHPNKPMLQLSLKIYARHVCRVPVGLHPILELSGLVPGSAFLDIPMTSEAWTFPIDVEPNRSRFAPDQRAMGFTAIIAGQESVDIRYIPYGTATEDLVLLTNLSSGLALHVPTRGYSVRVDWDRSKLPNCLLWFSNGGRDIYPWNGVTRVIGIEPSAACFDLGIGYSLANDTPLSNNNISTAVELTPERPWSINYSIEVTSNP